MNLQMLSRNAPRDADRATGAEADAAPDAGRDVPAPRRRWVTRAAVPVAILLAAAALFAYAARDTILPATPVDVVRATALPSQAASADGDPSAAPAGPPRVVAQAPGWVEPDPYPIYVSALADGVVEKIHVLEGESVTAGQLLVEMVDDDARLALAEAKAELQRRRAALAAAQTNLKEPVALERAVAVARARLAEAKSRLARLDAEIAKEIARMNELAAAYDRVKDLSRDVISALEVDNAKYQLLSQQAVVKATRQRRPELEAVIESAKAELVAAERDLELKTELIRARDEAEAAVAAAQTAVAEAELRLERMTIESPVDGVVMTRLVSPGAKLIIRMEGTHSAHAIHLYDPDSLQVRVDVPLADAAAVGVGQQAIIIVDVLPDTEFSGEVTRVVHQADIAKNTVQFKVAITDPSPLLKPDMLARVKFLSAPGTPGGPGTPGAPGTPTSTRSATTGPGGGTPVVIARAALVDADSDEPFVWWVDPETSTIARRPVAPGSPRGEDRIEIRAGLNPGDVIVHQPDASLNEGQRVRTTD